LYEVVKRRYDRAGIKLDKAEKALEKWEVDHEEEEFSPLNKELLALKKDVNDATLNFQIFDQALQNAERRWKNARGAAHETDSWCEPVLISLGFYPSRLQGLESRVHSIKSTAK
jgi:hypothetical protein